MKSTSYFLKLVLFTTWAGFAAIFGLSYLFHVIFKLIDGPFGKLYSPWMLGYLGVTAVIFISFYMVFVKTKFFNLEK